MKDICIQAPQIDIDENNYFSTSVSTGTTTQSGPVIEEHILSISNNLYHTSKSQEEKKKPKDFTRHMGYAAKKKTSKQHKAKKVKLTGAQQLKKNDKTTLDKNDMNIPTTKEHI